MAMGDQQKNFLAGCELERIISLQGPFVQAGKKGVSLLVSTNPAWAVLGFAATHFNGTYFHSHFSPHHRRIYARHSALIILPGGHYLMDLVFRYLSEYFG